MDAIIADIRKAHKKDATTADNQTVAAKLKQDIEDAKQFEGSSQEKQVRIYCRQLGIPYDNLTPEEFAGIMGALKKSKSVRNAQSKRGKKISTQGRYK